VGEGEAGFPPSREPDYFIIFLKVCMQYYILLYIYYGISHNKILLLLSRLFIKETYFNSIE